MSPRTHHASATLRAAAALTLIAGLALPATTSATTTRVNSMGGATRFITVVDETNIWVFPSTIADWGNLAMIDNFDGTSGDFAFHYALTRDAVLVVYGGNGRGFAFGEQRGLGMFGVAPALSGAPTPRAQSGVSDEAAVGSFSQANETANFKGAIGFGMKTGGTNFGGLLSVYGDNRSVETNVTETDGPLRIDLLGGVGFEAGPGQLDLGFGLHFGFLTSEHNDAGGDDFAADGFFGLDAMARYMVDVAPGVEAIPYAGISFLKQGIKRTPPNNGTETKYGSTQFLIALGADLKIQPLNDVFIYPGAGLFFNSVTIDEDNGNITVSDAEQTFAIPYFSLAIDAKITDWLDWRLGAMHRDSFNTVADEVDQGGGATFKTINKDSSAQVIFTTGFGLRFGDWRIDMNIDPAFWVNGPYIVTGNTSRWALDVALQFLW